MSRDFELGRTWLTGGVDRHSCTGLIFSSSQLFDSVMPVFIFSSDDVLVGHKAVSQADHNPTNTLYDAKRFIGKQFTNDELNSEASHYPFKVCIFAIVCGCHCRYWN